jgi:hypothetical protein
VTDDLRAQIRDALIAGGYPPDSPLIDAVLPVVEAHGRAGAATALRQAADNLDAPDFTAARRQLRARADGIERQP